MSGKPVIFISHSSKDTELARLIKQQIEICIDGAEAFASDIEPGENWFEKVMGKLKEADAIIVLVTPNSVAFSHWVWFEMGYFWSQHDTALESLGERGRIYYPLFIPNVELPNPVHDLQIQAASLFSKRDLTSFFRNLAKRFGGQSSSVKYDEIIEIAKQIPKLARITQTKLSNSFEEDSTYSPYANYSETDLKEVVYDIAKNEWNGGDNSSALFRDGLIQFKFFDKEHNLPEGTSKTFLIDVMSRFNKIPDYESENIVRFIEEPYEPEPFDPDDLPF